LWSRVPESYDCNEHEGHHERKPEKWQGEEQAPYHHEQHHNAPPPEKQIPISHEEQKKNWYDIDDKRKKELEIGGGLLAGAALLGGGFLAYREHEKNQEEKKSHALVSPRVASRCSSQDRQLLPQWAPIASYMGPQQGQTNPSRRHRRWTRARWRLVHRQGFPRWKHPAWKGIFSFPEGCCDRIQAARDPTRYLRDPRRRLSRHQMGQHCR